jgi:hypothetical protein
MIRFALKVIKLDIGTRGLWIGKIRWEGLFPFPLVHGKGIMDFTQFSNHIAQNGQTIRE